MYMGVVLYAPCLALQTITDLPIFGLILLSGITGTVYTVLVSNFRWICNMILFHSLSFCMILNLFMQTRLFHVLSKFLDEFDMINEY